VANETGWQWTIRPGWDFRSPTEFGTLRTVVQLRVDQRNGVHESSNPRLTGTMRVSNMIHRGYIEWAGFLIGRAGSQFVYWDQDDVVTAIGGDPKTTAMQFTYVWNFGGGLKATLGLEDSAPWQAGDGIRDVSGNLTDEDGVIQLGPQRWRYDVIASLSTEQSWGNAKISGALHSVTTNSHTNAEGDLPDRAGARRFDTWGWGALAGITFNLPMLGAKDQLLLEATICDGAVAYCGINGGAENNATSFERSGQYLQGLNRNDVDVYAELTGSNDIKLHKTKAWAVAGQLRHYWSPLWRTNVMASYHVINVPKYAENLDVDNGGQGDAKVFDVGANLIWGQSRKTAEIGIEAAWKTVDQPTQNGFIGEVTAHGNRNPSGWVVSAFISRAW